MRLLSALAVVGVVFGLAYLATDLAAWAMPPDGLALPAPEPEAGTNQDLPRFDAPDVECERRLSEPAGAWCTPARETFRCGNGVSGVITRRVANDGACLILGIVRPPDAPR